MTQFACMRLTCIFKTHDTFRFTKRNKALLPDDNGKGAESAGGKEQEQRHGWGEIDGQSAAAVPLMITPFT